MEDPKERLREVRKEIDEIDEKIVYLIFKRVEYGREIAHLKMELNCPIEDGKREKEIRDRMYKLCEKYNLDFDVVWSVMKILVEYNKRVQREVLENL